MLLFSFLDLKKVYFLFAKTQSGIRPLLGPFETWVKDTGQAALSALASSEGSDKTPAHASPAAHTHISHVCCDARGDSILTVILLPLCGCFV